MNQLTLLSTMCLAHFLHLLGKAVLHVSNAAVELLFARGYFSLVGVSELLFGAELLVAGGALLCFEAFDFVLELFAFY